MLKVFATTQPTNFRWLELSLLDAPPVPVPASRAPVDRLEEMLAIYAAGQATTRDVEFACALADWETAAVEVTVSWY